MSGRGIFWIERAGMGELVGGDPAAMWGGDFAEGDVSAAEVFWGRVRGQEGGIRYIRYCGG